MPILAETGGLDTQIKLHDGTIITRADLFLMTKEFVRGEDAFMRRAGLTWRQNTWATIGVASESSDRGREFVPSCGTDCCAAGAVAIIDRGRGKLELSEVGIALDAAESDDIWGASDGADEIIFEEIANDEGDVVSISNYAGDLLGLTVREQREVFYGGNNADEICRLLDAVAERMGGYPITD